MTTDTANRIIAYLKEHDESTPRQLRQFLGIGAPALFRQLKKLQGAGRIEKIGSAPSVLYRLAESDAQGGMPTLPEDVREAIENEFMFVTPLGSLEEGVSGFSLWCTRHGLPVAKTAAEYVRTVAKYDAFKKNGYIDGLPKIRATFEKVYLDELYYLDFYSIERFGKTKLGALLLYAKQSQRPELFQRLFAAVVPDVRRLATEKQVSAVGFIPPTVARAVQLQKELERASALPLPTLKLIKATGTVPVPQKTLSRLDDRVENAKGSIFLTEASLASRILLIDDALGSGASLNETARKIKEKNPAAYVIGLALTGSFKGFDVLQEV